MKCSQFWVWNDGRLICNTPRQSGPGMSVGNAVNPPARLNTTQLRQISEWKRVVEVASGIRDYFEVSSYEPGSVDVTVSFSAPIGAVAHHETIRDNILEIVDQLKKAGLSAKIDRWAQAIDRRSLDRGPLPMRPIPLPPPGVPLVAVNDWVWKLMVELRMDDDIAGALGFVADEIDERSLSEHVVYEL